MIMVNVTNQTLLTKPLPSRLLPYRKPVGGMDRKPHRLPRICQPVGAWMGVAVATLALPAGGCMDGTKAATSAHCLVAAWLVSQDGPL